MHLSPPVAWAAVHSKAVVLLLFIYCLMCFPLFMGVLCLSLFWYALLCDLSSFAIILKRKRESWLLFFYCPTDVLSCKCSVALPNVAVGWSAVCDCGIS